MKIDAKSKFDDLEYCLEKQKERARKAESLPVEVLEQQRNLFAYLDMIAGIEEAEGAKIDELLITAAFTIGLEKVYKERIPKHLPMALQEYCYEAIKEAAEDEECKKLFRKLQTAINYINFRIKQTY